MVDGISPFTWRSGLKHDCAKVMELSKDNGKYVNGLGEVAHIEEELVYPLVKSADVKGKVITQSRKYVIVTQHGTNEETKTLKDKYPKAYQYLSAHADALDGRKSSIYRNRPRFSLFGVGDYTFKKYSAK